MNEYIDSAFLCSFNLMHGVFFNSNFSISLISKLIHSHKGSSLSLAVLFVSFRGPFNLSARALLAFLSRTAVLVQYYTRDRRTMNRVVSVLIMIPRGFGFTMSFDLYN